MHQAKSSLSRLVERALAGEEVVIARNGEALVRLMPPKTRVPGRDAKFTGRGDHRIEAPLALDGSDKRCNRVITPTP